MSEPRSASERFGEVRRMLVLLAIAAGAVVGRRHLVHLLTRTTGTWVGTPGP